MERKQWHWQEEGTAWKGVGIYHVTLTIPSRAPLLGTLIIPDNEPKQAYVERTDLGKKIVHNLALISKSYPEIRLLQYCIMPDHLHAILHVTRSMNTSIRMIMRGFWQGAKKAVSSVVPNSIRVNEQNPTSHDDSIFTERPFIRPMSRRGQLNTMIHYVRMNPQRLATKRLMPDLFWVQDNIEIAGRIYKGVGCADLLQRAQYMPVHTRGIWIENAEKHGDDNALRDYMNDCILAARQGIVMVSPFISKYEQMVMVELLKEGLPFIYIADNGFCEYYKPQDSLFDAVARKQVLILSPWDYDPNMKRVSRSRCIDMNNMAAEICEDR